MNAQQGEDAPGAEPEITARKLLIAGVCLLGSGFIPYVQAMVGPLMMLPMLKEFGWTRTEYAFATTFMFFFGSLTALLSGRIADRFGSRTILVLGAVCGGATMLLLSRQDAQLWRLYLAYSLLGIFGSTGLGYMKIIGTLFARHRGKALALFGAESTVAMAAIPLITNYLILHQGWRGTYVVYALIMFALSPVLYVVIRGPGLSEPLRAPAPPQEIAPGAPATSAPAPEGLTPPQIRRDRTFWLIMLSVVVVGGFNGGFLTHIIVAITDKGFTATQAASVLSAATLMGLAGSLAAGFAMDHFRTSKILTVFALASATGLLLFALASTSIGGLPLIIAGLAIQRAAAFGIVPGTVYVLTRFVGMRSFGEAYGIQVLVGGIAMGVTAPLFGMIFDRTGSYALMYWMLIAGALVGAALYLTLGPYRYQTAGARPR